MKTVMSKDGVRHTHFDNGDVRQTTPGEERFLLRIPTKKPPVTEAEQYEHEQCLDAKTTEQLA